MSTDAAQDAKTEYFWDEYEPPFEVTVEVEADEVVFRS